ncbi:ABC transporter permease [Bacillus sp. AK031]
MIASLKKRGKTLTSFGLFLARYRNNILYQYNVIKSVADWTVMLYIIIPAMVIGTLIYRSWWQEIPAWAERLPFQLFFFLAFLFILSGYFRTFVLEADQVFLVKHKKIFLALKRWGIVSSYFSMTIMTVCIGVFLAPFWLKHFEISMEAFGVFLLFFFCSKVSHTAVKGTIVGLEKSWSKTVFSFSAIFLQLVLWAGTYRLVEGESYLPLAAASILLIGLTFMINGRRIRSKKSIASDLQIERSLKVKWISLIFQLSYHVENDSIKPPRQKPRIFRKSQTIFKNRTAYFGFLEFFIKVMMRNFSYSGTYLQSLGALSFSQLVLPPLWLKLGAASLIALSILAWNDWAWNKLIAMHPIGNKYKNQLELMRAKNTTKTAAFIPFLLILLFSLLRYFSVL